MSFEILAAWEAKGTVRQDLLRRWFEDTNVANVSAEIILSEQHTESGAQPGIYIYMICLWHIFILIYMIACRGVIPDACEP